MILDAAEERPVFVKDMCYYVSGYILDDPDFVKRIRSTFLIRDPRKSISSYYRLDPELTCEEVGLESQYRQFEFTMELTGEIPLVVDASDLVAHTERLMRAYCRAVGIPFLEHSLNWSEELPKEWTHVAGWHADLTTSAGIRDRKKTDVDFQTLPKLRKLYDHHRPYYDKLRRYRMKV